MSWKLAQLCGGTGVILSFFGVYRRSSQWKHLVLHSYQILNSTDITNRTVHVHTRLEKRLTQKWVTCPFIFETKLIHRGLTRRRNEEMRAAGTQRCQYYQGIFAAQSRLFTLMYVPCLASRVEKYRQRWQLFNNTCSSSDSFGTILHSSNSQLAKKKKKEKLAVTKH